MNSNHPLSNWYVAYTYPNYEKKVYHTLLKKGVNVFLPLQNVIRQWSDRKKELSVPLFPSYIFIKTIPNEWFDILNTYGIARFVSTAGEPCKVSENEINTIKELVTSPDVTVDPVLEEGDKVIIHEGLFSGWTGILFKRKGKMRVGIKLESINQNISLELGSLFLRKVEPYV